MAKDEQVIDREQLIDWMWSLDPDRVKHDEWLLVRWKVEKVKEKVDGVMRDEVTGKIVWSVLEITQWKWTSPSPSLSKPI